MVAPYQSYSLRHPSSYHSSIGCDLTIKHTLRTERRFIGNSTQRGYLAGLIMHDNDFTAVLKARSTVVLDWYGTPVFVDRDVDDFGFRNSRDLAGPLSTICLYHDLHSD